MENPVIYILVKKNYISDNFLLKLFKQILTGAKITNLALNDISLVKITLF